MVYGLCVIIGMAIGGGIAAIGGGIVWLLYSIKAKRIIEDLRGPLAVSEEKNLRIPKLEMVVAKNKTQIAALEVISNHIIDNRAPVSVGLDKLLLVIPLECFVMRIEQLPQRRLLRLTRVVNLASP